LIENQTRLGLPRFRLKKIKDFDYFLAALISRMNVIQTRRRLF
jgi:hypothetical protein